MSRKAGWIHIQQLSPHDIESSIERVIRGALHKVRRKPRESMGKYTVAERLRSWLLDSLALWNPKRLSLDAYLSMVAAKKRNSLCRDLTRHQKEVCVTDLVNENGHEQGDDDHDRQTLQMLKHVCDPALTLEEIESVTRARAAALLALPVLNRKLVLCTAAAFPHLRVMLTGKSKDAAFDALREFAVSFDVEREFGRLIALRA